MDLAEDVIKQEGEEKTLSKDSPPQWIIDLVVWIGKDPYGFLVNFFLIVSPFMLMSAFLSWKLSKMIDKKESKEKKVLKKNKNRKQLRRLKAD